MSNPRITEPTNASYISKIVDPAAHVHIIRDSWARGEIDYLKEIVAGGTKFLGVTTTPLTDGSTTATIVINGTSVTLTAQDSGAIVLYNNPSGSSGSSTLEFIWDGAVWREIGTQGLLKALAYKDSASGNYQPKGTVAVSGITPAGTNKFNFKPEGTVSAPTITLNNVTTQISFLNGATYDGTDTLTFSSTTSEVMTGSSATASECTFTGVTVTDSTTAVVFEGTTVTPTATFTGITETITVS